MSERRRRGTRAPRHRIYDWSLSAASLAVLVFACATIAPRGFLSRAEILPAATAGAERIGHLAMVAAAVTRDEVAGHAWPTAFVLVGLLLFVLLLRK